MKRYCKNVDITNRDFVKRAVMDCLSGKLTRRDTIQLLAEYSNLPQKFLLNAIHNHGSKSVNGIIEAIVDGISEELKNGKIKISPIWYLEKIDGSSGKLRRIGIQGIKQQLYDYVAVYGLKELFQKKIGYYQCAAIPGKGQIFGKNAIQRWLEKKESRYCAKGDVKKCYESIDKNKLKKLLSKYVKNERLLNLTFVLIDSFEKGLSIGSYLSQFLCNFYLSFAYHYASEKMYKKKKKRNKAHEFTTFSVQISHRKNYK